MTFLGHSHATTRRPKNMLHSGPQVVKTTTGTEAVTSTRNAAATEHWWNKMIRTSDLTY